MRSLLLKSLQRNFYSIIKEPKHWRNQTTAPTHCKCTFRTICFVKLLYSFFYLLYFNLLFIQCLSGTFKISICYCFSPVTQLSKPAVSGRSKTAPHWLKSGINSNLERRVPMTAVFSVCLSQSILNSIWRRRDMENPTTTQFSELIQIHHIYMKTLFCLWCTLTSPVISKEWIYCRPAILTLTSIQC